MAIPIPAPDEEAQEILNNSKPLTPGIYSAVVEGVEETTVQSEASDHFGKPMLKLVFKITQEPAVNRKAWRTMIFSGKPLGFALTGLAALGVPQEQATGDFDSKVLIGRPCRLSIGYPKNTGPDDGVLHEVKSILKATSDQQAASVMP